MIIIHRAIYLYIFLRITDVATQQPENGSGRIAYSKHAVPSFHPRIDRTSAFPGLGTGDVTERGATYWLARPTDDTRSISGLSEEAGTPPNFEAAPAATAATRYEYPVSYSYSSQDAKGHGLTVRSFKPPPYPYLPYEDTYGSKDKDFTTQDSGETGETWREMWDDVIWAIPAYLNQPTMNPKISSDIFPMINKLYFPKNDAVKDGETPPRLLNNDAKNIDREEGRPNRHSDSTEPNGSSFSWKSLPHLSKVDIRSRGNSQDASQKQYRAIQGLQRYLGAKTSNELTEDYTLNPSKSKWKSGNTYFSKDGGLPSDDIGGAEGLISHDYPSADIRQAQIREKPRTLSEYKGGMGPKDIWDKYVKPHVYADGVFSTDNTKTTRVEGRNYPVMTDDTSDIMKKEMPSVEELEEKAAKILSQIDTYKDEFLKRMEGYFKSSNILPSSKSFMEKKRQLFPTQKHTTRAPMPHQIKPILGTLSGTTPTYEFPVLQNYKKQTSKLISGHTPASVIMAPRERYTDDYTAGTRIFWPALVNSPLQFTSKFSKALMDYLQQVSMFSGKLPMVLRNSIPVTNREVEMTFGPDFSKLPPGTVETIEGGAGGTPGKHEGGGFKIKIHKS
ncbi:uncharacterized protein LOC124165467 [Ischnura elegans]|uniref:uncharacterized protein LOC124165467 n=1 Tax=Ischnura elegans TaxID=197161 RepID=UPI001ED8AAC1|nr:uncharacterized protein LOC124165467 [Ischnura elegans]